MYQDNVIALDLAKNVIQVCILDKQNEVKTNRELRRQQVLNWPSSLHTLPPLSPHKPPPSSPHAFERGSPEKVI